jgi:hypothetical protein
MDWALVLLNAKNFLMRSNLVTSGIPLPAYYEFARRCFFHVRDVGFKAAAALVSADIDAFVSYGFNRDILHGLARLQGVAVEV